MSENLDFLGREDSSVNGVTNPLDAMSSPTDWGSAGSVINNLIPADLSSIGGPSTSYYNGVHVNNAIAQEDSFNSMIAQAGQQASNSQLPGYRNPIAFGKSQTNYERYYNHPKFKDLGFSPFRDNEGLYNQHASWGDEYSRMFGQFGKLFTTGFTSSLESFGDLIGGEPTKLFDSAGEEYSKAAEIGMTSKGGPLGFANNLILNSGYTIGLLSEIALEELALGALTVGTGGASSVLAAGRTAENLGKVSRIGEMATATRNFLKGLDQAGSARTFFTSTGKFINPLENTFEAYTAIKGLNTGANAVYRLDNAAKATKYFGSFYRDVRNINAALSEGKLEGSMVRDEVYNTLIDEYRMKNNFMLPEGKEHQDILDQANKAGFETEFKNLPLLYFTNKITFDNIFKGYKPLQNVMKEGAGTIADDLIKVPMKGGLKGAMQYTEKTIGKTLAQPFVAPKEFAKNALGKGIRYTTANFSEGFQELAQETLSDGIKKYYIDTFRDPSLIHKNYMNASMKDAMDRQIFSAQGMETFLSGFLMGGVAGPFGNFMYKTLPKTFQYLTDKTAYTEYANQKKELLTKTKTILNETLANPFTNFSNSDANMVSQRNIQKKMEEAAERGEKLEYQDAKDEALFEAVNQDITSGERLLQIAQTGKLSEVRDYVEKLGQLSDEEFKQAFNLAGESKSVKIKEVLDRIDVLSEANEVLNDKYGANPFKPELYKPGSIERKNEEIDFRAWENSKRIVLYHMFTNTRAIERKNALLETAKASGTLKNMAASDFDILFSDNSLNKELQILDIELSQVGEITDPALKKDIDNKAKKRELLKAFKEQYDLNLKKDGTYDKRKVSNLYKKYVNYIKFANEKDGNPAYIQDSVLENTFDQLFDYKVLDLRSQLLEESINYLLDPMRFKELTERTSKVLTEAFEQRKKDVTSSDVYEKHIEMLEKNNVLATLQGMGVLVDPNEAVEFAKTGKVPTTFYHDSVIGAVKPTDEIYQNIMVVFEAVKQIKLAEENRAKAEKTAKSTEFSTDTTEEEEELGSEDIEDVSEFTQTVVRRAYDDYLKSLREVEVPISFEEFVATKKGASIVNAITTLEAAYDAITDEAKPEFIEWLRTNARTPLVYDALNKNNVTFSDIFIQQRDENQYNNDALEEGETVVSPGYNGVFITKVTVVDDNVDTDVYFVKTNQGIPAIEAAGTPDQLIDIADDIFTDLKRAEKAQKKIGDYLANTKKQFVFDNIPLIYGQIISDNKNNEFIVLSYPREIESGSDLKLKNAKTGAILTTKSFAGFKLDRAPVEKKEYTSRFDSVSTLDRAWGKRMEGESQKDATTRLSNFLRDTPTEQLQEGLSIKVTNLNKSPERYAYLKLEDQKENQSVGFFRDSYAIALVFNGEEIGYLPNPTSFQFLDTQGNPISIDRINADRVKQAFYLRSGRYNQAVAEIKKGYKNKVALLNYLKSKLGKKDSVEIPYKDLNKVANINIGLGSYDFLSRDEARPKFSELSSNTIDGAIYVIDRENKYIKGSITSIEGSPITDIDSDILESTEKEIDAARYSKSGVDALLKYGRYVAVVKLPNGKIRFVELTTPALSNEDLNTLASDLKARIELTKKENINAEGEVKAEEYNDIWNKENIDQKLFISLPLKERGKFLNLYVAPDASLVIDFVNKNTRGSEISRKQFINDPEFNTFSELLSLVNAGIKEHDAKVKLEDNKMDVVLTGRSFKASLPKSIDTLQVLDMEASVGPNVVKDVSVYIDMLEPASDVQADPLLPKVNNTDLTPTDVNINNLDLSNAPAGSVFNPDLLRGVAPVNPVPVSSTSTEPADIKAEVENKLFSETDNKGRTYTYYSTSTEKDGRIKTTFTFNRSDKDASQRSNAVSGIPVEKALGNKYTIDEESLPKESKVVGVVEIRLTENGAGATVTVESEGQRWQTEVKLNTNTTYDAELAALGQPTEKPIQVSSADALNRVLAAQQSIPQQIKQLQTQVDDKTDEVRKVLLAQRLSEKGELTTADKKEIRIQAENSPEVLAIKGQIDVLSKAIGLKVVAAGYTESDITNLTEFLTWAQNNLPDFVTVEDLDTLKNNLYTEGKTVGAFVSSLSNVAGNVEVNGIIYTSASSPFKYHEAFHAVFRLLLSDAQISKYLTIAKKELRDQLRKEGKSFALAKEEMRMLHPMYAAMSESQLEERMYEEYLADKFEEWKINKKTETNYVNKGLFARIVEWIKKVFSRFGKNELNSLFDNIDAGKYRNSKVVTNRFTDSPFDISEPVLKAIKIGTDTIEDSTFAAEGEVKYIKVDKYLPEQEGTRLSATVAAIYNNKLKDATKETNTDELLDSVLDIYEELYDPDLDQYADLDTADLNKLKEYRLIFSKTENRDILKESVREHLAILSIKETNEDDVSEDITSELGERGKQNYTEGAAAQGGFGSLSKFLRSWISTVTYQSADEFGNSQFLDGTPYIQSVDGSTVYNGILQAISGTENVEEVLLKLNLYKDRNFESGKVIEEFFTQTGVTFDEDGNVDLENVKNSYLFQSFIKGFGQYAVDYLFINKDLKKEIANIISANRKDSGKVQFDQWSQAYSSVYESKLTPELKKRAKSVLTKLKGAMAPTKKYTDDELVQKTNELSVELMEVLGISLSGMYLSYSIVNNIQKLTDQQLTLFKLYSGIKPIDMEDIRILSNLIEAEENPFINLEYETETDAQTGEIVAETEILSGGATTRLYNMAKANTVFDESVYATSWKNAEGQLVYVHQLPSYHLVKINEIKKAGGIEELLQDPFLQDNFLLNNDNFKDILSLVNVKRIDGQKVSSLTETGEGDIIENKQLEVNRREGTTYGSYSPEEFITTLIDLYSSGEVREINGKKFADSFHLIRVLEASSTGNVVNIPIVKAVKKAGTKNVITDEAKNAILGFVEQEYNRISRVATEETDEEIYNYNTGKMRGLTLFKTGKLLTEDFKNELEEQAKQNLPLTDAQKNQIKTEAVNSLLDEVDVLIDLLETDNIIEIDDKNKVTKSALAGFVSKGFRKNDKNKSVDKTRNSIYNLVSNDYKHNLIQIYFNDFINTTAINQLMHGDHALSLKDAVDEVKRAKGSNATGSNIASGIKDERLGINHAFRTAHVVTIADPLFKANYAGIEGEKANAQMWMTVKALRYTLFGLGKLSPIQAELLNKIEKGETITGDFFFGDNKKKGAVSFDAATNSIKLVYFDGQTYIKTSGVVLTKELTSYGSDFQYALPGKEELHSLRNTLEAYEKDRETVGLAVPVSASKGKKVNVASDVNSITDRNFIETDTKYWRLQLENPSNKIKITDTTQIKTIITAEQDNETIVDFMGTDITVGQLKEIYKDASINRVKVNYIGKRNAIFTLKTGLDEVRKSIAAGSVTPKLAAFQRYAIETLKSSAGDAQMIEFFELDEQGEPKYDLNSPITIDKFVELFLSYFSKGVLSEKIPGHAVALMSDFGMKQLKKVLELDENGQPKRWEIVRVEEFKTNPSKYGTPKTQSDLENRTFNNLEVGDYYIDDLRHNVPEYDKNGKITGYFTEFVMPAHFKELLSFIKPGDKIPDAVAKMFGVRIPSQDKHSAVALKLVDFMPVYYGSTAVFPQELIEISGADFDIDKLYIAIQEWLVENGEFKAYGSGTTKTEKFNQFVKYQFSKNKEFRKTYNDYYQAFQKEADEFKDYATDYLDELDIIDEDATTLDLNKKEIIEATLKALNLPADADEYNTKIEKLGYEPYQGALNNTIVNARIGLLNNSAMVTAEEGQIPKAFQVATVDPLINTVKSFIERFPELRDQLEEGRYNVDTLLGKYFAFRNNKEGARNIGPAVNSLLVYTLLNANGIDIRKTNTYTDETGEKIDLTNLRFKLNGKEFNTYTETQAYNPETGEYDGERIMFILSALVSAMTDNAKERLAAKLNLNIDSLGVVANMIAQGVSLDDSILFINQPAIREFYKRLRTNKSSYATDAQRKKGKGGIIKDLIEEYDVKEIPSNITTADLEEGIRRNIPAVQVAVLNSFKTLTAQSDTMMNVSAVLKVNKGLPKDLTEFDEIYDKAVDLGLEMTDKEFEASSIPFDIRKLLRSSDNTFGFNFTVYREIKSLMGSIMLNRTPVVNRLREIVVSNTEVNFRDRKNFKNTLDKNLISFFAIKAYVNILNKGGYKRALASLNNGMIYDQTASTLPENMSNVTDVVKKLRELRPNNYFTNKFLFAITAANRSNKDAINKVEFNNWTKLSKLQLNKIQYSFMELYTDEITRPYAIDLFHYLLVKDGGQFKSGSFIRVMPNFMFEMILNSSGAAVNALKGQADDRLVQKTFGASLNELYNEFVRGFLQSSSITFFTKTIKTKITKDDQLKELKKDLDIASDVKLESPILVTDNKLEINVFKNTSFEKEMIPLGDVSNYKGDEMIVDSKGNYQIVQPMVALPGPAKLTEDGKKLYRYNLRYLKAAGFIQESKDEKTQIGFPLVIKRVEYAAFDKTTTYYRLTTVKRDRVTNKENLADLIQPGDMYAFGVSAEYEKFDPIGSRKQFAAGFVLPGSLPTSKGIFANRKNKDIFDNPGAIPDLNNIDFDVDFEKQLAGIDFSKAPADINSTLASNGIQAKTVGKKIVYEKDGKPFETNAKSPEELAKTLTPKSEELELGDIDALIASAPAAAFNPAIGAMFKARTDYPILNEFFVDLTDEQKERIKEDMGIDTFISFVEQYKGYVNTVGGDQNSFVEQIKKCYL